MKYKLLIMSAVLINHFQSSQAYAEENQIQGVPYVTVGADNDNTCDFHGIQDAIDNGLSDIIRIASNKNYFENLEIEDESKQLIGGYADCTQAGINITDLSQAIITGNGSGAVLGVDGVGIVDGEILIRNLILANGYSGVFISSENSANYDVTLRNVRLFNNSIGLQIQDLGNGVSHVVVSDTIIDNNSNGGVYCNGENTELKIAGDSFIKDNTTVDKGAGIRAGDGCDINIYSPVEISNNKADGSGGGVHVSSSASVNLLGLDGGCQDGICFGEWESPVKLLNNVADEDNSGNGDGGGVYINGGNASVTIYNALIEGNKANFGGAFYVSSDSTLIAAGYQSPGTDCWSSGSCLQITNNEAQKGGVLQAIGNNSETIITAASINENSANDGVIVRLFGDAKVDLLNSVIFNNGENGDNLNDLNLFDIFANQTYPDAHLTLDYVTIADNHVVSEVIKNTDSEVDVYSSIIFDEQNVYSDIGAATQPHFECVIAHENNSFSAGGTVTVVDHSVQPVFVNPQAGNYHLLVDSPAIDYCYDASGNGGSDIEYDDRGVDNQDMDDFHGVFDVGADEFHINNDIIFKHGFEQD